MDYPYEYKRMSRVMVYLLGSAWKKELKRQGSLYEEE